jgi:hypothetical protein
MDFKKTIGVGLLVLLSCQSALFGAGSFFMCLHHAGGTHRVEDDSADDCCHQPEAVSEHMYAFEGCTDFEVASVELFPWRDNGRLLDRVAINSVSFDWINVAISVKPIPYAIGLSRAPPVVAAMSVRFAQTVCLRI